MGTIKSTKDQPLAVGVLNPSKVKKKARYSKQQEKPKYSDGFLSPTKDKEKKKQEKKKCTYCHKGWHPESACMKKPIDMMAQILKRNKILDSGRQSLGQK